MVESDLHRDLDCVEATVGHSDKLRKGKCRHIRQINSNDQNTPQIAGRDRELGGVASAGAVDPESDGDRPALGLVHVLPKPQPGQFVRIIDELAYRWSSKRRLTTQKPVQRNLKIVSEGDD